MWPDVPVELVDEVPRADEPEDVVDAPVCVTSGPLRMPESRLCSSCPRRAGNDVIIAAGPRAPEVEAARVLAAKALILEGASRYAISAVVFPGQHVAETP